VREIYLMAYELNCKGVTVYRDASRPAQVLSTGKTTKDVTAATTSSPAVTDLEAQLADARERLHRYEHRIEQLRTQLEDAESRMQTRRHKRNRPAALKGATRRMPSPLGDLYVTINEDEGGKPFEVFATLGKAGGAAMADVEGIGRLISLALRSGIPIADVIQQLRGIACDRAVGLGPNKVLSVPDAIAQALAQHMQEKLGVQQELLPLGGAQPAPAPVQTHPAASGSVQPQPALDFGYDPGETFIGTCPECSSGLQFMEGCVKCLACGYSECG
jgi:ribonucleoside-diphosphate reductase alpha chain